jgi:hypothetical protein
MLCPGCQRCPLILVENVINDLFSKFNVDIVIRVSKVPIQTAMIKAHLMGRI